LWFWKLGEQFIEEMTRDGLERAKSKLPENEDVTCALSYFTGPPGGAEVKKLVAAVTNNMCALGEIDDEDVLRRNAEPEVIEFEEGRDKSRAGDFSQVMCQELHTRTLLSAYGDVVSYENARSLPDIAVFTKEIDQTRN
jgi:hypothetical protein